MPSRPISGPVPVSGDTASHASYNVGPATDYAVGSGTVIRAPFAGDVSYYWSASGGNTIVVNGADALMAGQHLSSYIRRSGSVSERDNIAYSGNTGSTTSGPHFHCFFILNDGTRLSGEEWAERAGLGFVPYTEPWTYTPSGSAAAGSDFEIIPEKPKPSGVPMFNLITVPDEGLVYVQGLDGRRKGVQGPEHLEALLRYRDAMLTPGAPLVMYFGDLTGARGNIDWYLGQVNGPRAQVVAEEHEPAPYKFTDAELAKIGAAAQVDVAGIAGQIAALDKQADDYQAKLTALLNREFVLAPR